MARYATLQQQQQLELPAKPFSSTRKQQSYRLLPPALEQACEVHLYESAPWLQEQLPYFKVLLQQASLINGLPLDVVLDEKDQAVGVVVPLAQGEPMFSALLSLPPKDRGLLTYQLLLLIATIEQKTTAVLVFDLSQFFVSEQGQVTWQWNATALASTSSPTTNYASLIQALLPEFSAVEQPISTALEAAVWVLMNLPFSEAQLALEQEHLPADALSESRLPIPPLVSLNNKALLEELEEVAMDWPVLEPVAKSLEAAPLVGYLETGIWLSFSAVLLFVLTSFLVLVGWPALQTAYEQDFYALVGAWLVGGFLLVSLCLVLGSYVMLKGARWSSQQVQIHFATTFYYQHPNLLRAEDHPTAHSNLLLYKAQQKHLQETLEDLIEEGHYLQAKIQQCQELMIQIRTQANRQLEQLHEEYQAVYWHTAQQQQQQLVVLLQQRKTKQLLAALQQLQGQPSFLSLEQSYKQHIAEVKQRYGVAQSTQQQEWKQYEQQGLALKKEWQEWQFLQELHWEKRALMEQQAQAWTLRDYHAALEQQTP